GVTSDGGRCAKVGLLGPGVGVGDGAGGEVLTGVGVGDGAGGEVLTGVGVGDGAGGEVLTGVGVGDGAGGEVLTGGAGAALGSPGMAAPPGVAARDAAARA